MKKIINVPNIIILFCVLDILSSYLMGINRIFLSLLFILMPVRLITPLLFIILLIRTIIALIKKQTYKKQATILLASFLLFTLVIPNALYLGAITSLKIANEKQVLSEGKALIDSHKAYFEEEKKKNKAIPPQREIPKEELPVAIKKLSVGWVRVYEKGVVMKKLGFGDVTGYLIAPGRKLSGIRKMSEGIYWLTPRGYSEEE